MSLMMGLTPGPLVHALFLFALKNPLVVFTTLLVVFVAWGLVFLSPQESSQLVTLLRLFLFVPKGLEPKGAELVEICWRPKS